MAAESSAAEPVLDYEGTLARFGGDKSLFIEMSGILLEDAPQILNRLRHAVAANDAMAVRSHAHALRGVLAGCGGVRAARVAQALEDAGLVADLRQASSLLETVEYEFDCLEIALRQYSP